MHDAAIVLVVIGLVLFSIWFNSSGPGSKGM